MKNFFCKEVPLWLTIFGLGLVITGAIVAFLEFRQIIYNYSFDLPNLPAGGGFTPYTYGNWPALNNENFYDKVLNDLIAQKATFISANLSTMQLRYYENGSVATTVAILAKGKSGSWWETPAGLYKVQAKVPSDFSSFAHVYSPWALAFQGNFLIHGWPYYPNGTPVGSTYSGGCIRLSTPDAKALYDMASIGTPVLVSSDNFTTDNFTEQQQGPPIKARSFLAADLKSNYVFAQSNPDERLPIASLTKLMTALVAVEYVDIEKTITITPDMIVKTSIPRLKVGQQYSLYDLLQPLLKESSNEAAAAISDFLGSKYFVSLMNQQAASIGMTNTHFVDPSGSNGGNVSTAHNLFVLAQYLYDNRSFILKMTTNNNDPNVYGPSAFATLQNFNVFSDDPDFIGGKVGVSGAASDTILSIFDEPFLVSAPSVASTTANQASAENISSIATSTATSTVKRPIMFVILGSDNYTTDANTLLEWIKNTYQ
jgi:D-alanyl-D-alanine carboxypeptidase